MALNMADFGKSCKSIETPWKASYMLENGFRTRFWIVCLDYWEIRKDPNLAEFDQKPWAIAHAIEHDGFWQVLEIAQNILKGLLSACKLISKCFRDYLNGFRVNSLGSEIGRFWAKAWAIAHPFEHSGFLQLLEIAPNFLKGLLCACKWISKCLRDYLIGFRVNSPGSEIGRFWAKCLGYSPCFWTSRILASVGNRSRLSERTPICFQMNF